MKRASYSWAYQALRFSCVGTLVAVLGCSQATTRTVDLEEPQTRLPLLAKQQVRSDLVKLGPEVKLSGIFEGNMDEFVEFAAVQGVVVVPSIPEDVDASGKIRLRWKGVPASTALQQVASQYGETLEVIRRNDNTYLLGVPGQRDLVVRVYRVTKDGADFETAVKVMLSTHGSLAAVGDRVIVRDTADVVDRVDEVFAGLVGAAGQYLVEIRFVELTQRGASTLGVDWELVGSVSLDAVAGSGVGALTGLAQAQLEGMFRATETDTDVRLLTMARLHVLEGEDAELQVGDTTPFPTTQFNSDGVPIGTSFEFVDTGLVVEVGIRSEPDGRLRVRLRPELSQVTGTVEGAPVRSRRRLSTSAVVEPGDVVVVGGFTSERYSRTEKRLPLVRVPGQIEKDKDTARLFVACRVVDPTSKPGARLGTAQAAPAAEVKK